jgi:hypothetical protein
MPFDTKIAIVVREDLAPWQKLNVTAFLSGGLAGSYPEIVANAIATRPAVTMDPWCASPS